MNLITSTLWKSQFLRRCHLNVLPLRSSISSICCYVRVALVLVVARPLHTLSIFISFWGTFHILLSAQTPQVAERERELFIKVANAVLYECVRNPLLFQTIPSAQWKECFHSKFFVVLSASGFAIGIFIKMDIEQTSTAFCSECSIFWRVCSIIIRRWKSNVYLRFFFINILFTQFQVPLICKQQMGFDSRVELSLHKTFELKIRTSFGKRNFKYVSSSTLVCLW